MYKKITINDTTPFYVAPPETVFSEAVTIDSLSFYNVSRWMIWLSRHPDFCKLTFTISNVSVFTIHVVRQLFKKEFKGHIVLSKLTGSPLNSILFYLRELYVNENIAFTFELDAIWDRASQQEITKHLEDKKTYFRKLSKEYFEKAHPQHNPMSQLTPIIQNKIRSFKAFLEPLEKAKTHFTYWLKLEKMYHHTHRRGDAAPHPAKRLKTGTPPILEQRITKW